MSINPVLALSTVEHSYEHTDQGREYYDGIINFLDSEENHSMKLSDLEQELEKRGRELMRILLQEHLDKLSHNSCEQPVCGSDGIDRPNVRSHDRKIETVFGTVSTNRAGYGNEGVASLHPLDAQLNLPSERYSLELRRRVAENAAKSSFDETLETIEKTTGAHIPKRQVEELTQRAALDFDSFYETRQYNPADEATTGTILVITTDGKGVVMHEQDLREQTRKAAQKRKPQMETRLSKGEKKNAKRIATVAAVYTIDTFHAPLKIYFRETTAGPIKKKAHARNKNVYGQALKNQPKRSLNLLFQKHPIVTPGRKKIGLLWWTVKINNCGYWDVWPKNKGSTLRSSLILSMSLNTCGKLAGPFILNPARNLRNGFSIGYLKYLKAKPG